MASNQQKTNIWIDGSQAGATLTELKKKVSVLNKEIKDLPRNSDAYKAKMNELSQASGALTQHRNQIKGIGDAYQPANNGIRGMISQFAPMAGGLALAGAAIGSIVSGISSWYQNNKLMEKSLSSLQALTGASTEDLKFYKEQAIEIGKSSTMSASQVVEAFKLIGSARPDLLKNKDALAEVTAQTVVLAEAAEMELGSAAQSLAGAMNQFNLGAEHSERIINALAAGSKEGAAEIEDVTLSIEKFGAVAESNNVTFEESVALTELMAEKNIKGAEAGTQLRNVLLTVATAASLPKEAQDAMKQYGVNLDIVSDKSLPLKDRLNELKKVQGDQNALVKIFGKENVIAGQTVLGNVEKFDTLTKAVTGTNTAYEQQKINNDNLDGALKQLGSAWEAYTLKLGGAGGGMDNIKNAVKFLSENLEDVIGFVGKVIVAFTTYKAITIGIRTAQMLMNAEFRKSIFSFKDLGKSAEGAGASAGKFGGALKSIGLTALIGLVIEMAQGFYDIASGAAAARFEMERYNKSLESGSKFGTDSVKRIQEKFEADKQALDLKLAEQKITKENYDNEIRLLNNFTDQKIKSEITLANESKKAAKDRGDKAIVAQENATLKELIALQKERANGAVQTKIEILNSNKEISKANLNLKNQSKKDNKDFSNQLEELIKNANKIYTDFQTEKVFDNFKSEKEKELFELRLNLEEKYQSEIQSAFKLSQEKGDIGLKANEQLLRLIALQDEEYEYKKKEIEEKFRKEAAADKLKEGSDLLEKSFQQDKTFQESIATLKVTKAKLALDSIIDGDLSGYRLAKENLIKALEEEAALKLKYQLQELDNKFFNEEISKQELNVRKEQLELEHQQNIVDINAQSAEQLKEIDNDRTQNALENIQKVMDIAKQFSDASSQQQLNMLNQEQKREQQALDEKFKNKLISEDQYNEEKKKIDAETAKKKYDIELEQFNKNQAFATAEAIIQGALAIAKITAQTGVAAPFAIPLVVASTAAQLAMIAAQAPPEAPQFAEGGFAEVTGAKDGLRYRAQRVGKLKPGFTPNRPILGLFGEKGPEYVIPNHLLRKQPVARFVSMMEAERMGRVPQFADGGLTSGSMEMGAETLQLLKQNNALYSALMQYLPNLSVQFSDKNIEDLEKNTNRFNSAKN